MNLTLNWTVPARGLVARFNVPLEGSDPTVPSKTPGVDNTRRRAKRSRENGSMKQKSMLSIHYKHHILSSIYFCINFFLAFLLMACSSNTPPVAKGVTPTQGIVPPTKRFITPTSATTTVAMPPTQTDCPPDGTARAILTA